MGKGLVLINTARMGLAFGRESSATLPPYRAKRDVKPCEVMSVYVLQMTKKLEQVRFSYNQITSYCESNVRL